MPKSNQYTGSDYQVGRQKDIQDISFAATSVGDPVGLLQPAFAEPWELKGAKATLKVAANATSLCGVTLMGHASVGASAVTLGSFDMGTAKIGSTAKTQVDLEAALVDLEFEDGGYVELLARNTDATLKMDVELLWGLRYVPTYS